MTMKKTFISLALGMVLVFSVSTVMAVQIDPVYQDGPQDPLNLAPFGWHELGDFFPPNELIESQWTPTNDTACFDGSDDPAFPNVLVSMTNLTPIFWHDLHYVADPETTITNFDGWIGIAGTPLEEAFRIDNIGPLNFPLVFESIAPNLIFEPGETWQFIIQDFSNALGGPPTPFDSIGYAGGSAGWPPSTGSIIGRPVPIPPAVLLLGSGLIALVGIRRRIKR
jgi:hypothetical protein